MRLTLAERLPSFYIDVPALRPGTVGAYALAFASVGVATVLRLAIDPYVVGVPFITFFPAVIITTLISGFGAGLFCVVLSAVAADFFVLQPRFSFYLENPADAGDLVLFVPLASFCVILITRMRLSIEREQAQRALRESKERLQLALDAAQLGWWQYDPLHHVTLWDKRLKQMFDVAKDKTDTGEFTKRVHPEDLEKVWAAIEAALDPADPKAFATEFRHLRGDGEVRWVEAHGLTHFEDALPEWRAVSMVGTAQDITERKLREELVQRQADLLNQSQDAILTWKIGRGIAYWNRGAERLYGYTAGEAEGRRTHELLHTRAPISIKDIDARIVHGESWSGELTHTTRDGREIVVESRIVPVSYDGEMFALETNRDITDRKRAEDALRDSEERLRAIYDGTYQYIGLLSPDGTLLEANRASLEFAGDAFGSKREHVVGRPFWETVWFVHTSGAPEKLREAIGRAAAGEFIRYEAPLIRPSGEEVIFDFSLHPVRNKQGDVFLIVPEGRIITDRKRAEEELAKSEKRFRTSILHSPVPTTLYDDREQVLAISQSWLKAARVVSADHFRCLQDWTIHAYGESSGEALELIREIIATEPETRTDELTLTLGGEKRIWNFVSSGLGTQSDGRRLFITVALDVTDRRTYEERTELLMREARHRTKNILSLVQVIARQTAAGEAQDFIGRFSKRIQALAANQDLLVRHEWHRIDVKDLVQSQLGHFADLIGTRINFDGPRLLLNAAAAQAIGLAIHELATNAGKYGALSVNMGRLEISWGADSDAFTMRWVERDGPPASPPKRRGFGTIVMEAMAERSVDGKVDLDYAPSGLTWRLTCPVAKVLESNGDTGSRGLASFRTGAPHDAASCVRGRRG